MSWGADPNFGDTARGIPSALALTRRGEDLFGFDCRNDRDPLSRSLLHFITNATHLMATMVQVTFH